MPSELRRSAVLHVVDHAGRPLGTFACSVELPYLQETSDLLTAARAVGLELVVLRLLEHHVEDGRGTIHAVYLAEALSSPPPGVLRAPATELALDDHPLRASYARLGGLMRDVAWADGHLAARGWRRSGPPQQQRTWNLSCVSRLPLIGGGCVWLKVVPRFFAHEGAMIHTTSALDEQRGDTEGLSLPRLIAWDHDHGRVLLEPCDGSLMWGASYEAWRPVVAAHLERQRELAPHVDQLLSAGACDLRAPAFLTAALALCARDDVLSTLSAEARAGMRTLVSSLPRLFDEVTRCGLPDTLVHGDLHPGNVMAGVDGAVLLDWGDASVGLPLLDLRGLGRAFGPQDVERLEAQVLDAWSAHLPAARVRRALELSPILWELHAALVYQGFLDHIEPLEQHFHRDDVAPHLTAAVELSRRT